MSPSYFNAGSARFYSREGDIDRQDVKVWWFLGKLNRLFLYFSEKSDRFIGQKRKLRPGTFIDIDAGKSDGPLKA